jgi:hypothetical protein
MTCDPPHKVYQQIDSFFEIRPRPMPFIRALPECIFAQITMFVQIKC